jgi:hypothetical protein
MKKNWLNKKAEGDLIDRLVDYLPWIILFFILAIGLYLMLNKLTGI